MKSVRSIASIIAFIAVLICSQNQPAGAQGNAQIIEYWECCDRFKVGSCGGRSEFGGLPVLVKLTRLRTGNLEFGKIQVAGSTRKAVFKIQGIDRRWDFGDSDSALRLPYTFIITPNNGGLYYDFTTKSEAKPSQLFKCKVK